MGVVSSVMDNVRFGMPIRVFEPVNGMCAYKMDLFVSIFNVDSSVGGGPLGFAGMGKARRHFMERIPR
jgi:hypothetical protein